MYRYFTNYIFLLHLPYYGVTLPCQLLWFVAIICWTCPFLDTL